jgi:hypothetical protein
MLFLSCCLQPHPDGAPSSTLEGCLRCLACLCIKRDAARQQLVDAKVMMNLVLVMCLLCLVLMNIHEALVREQYCNADAAPCHIRLPGLHTPPSTPNHSY